MSSLTPVDDDIFGQIMGEMLGKSPSEIERQKGLLKSKRLENRSEDVWFSAIEDPRQTDAEIAGRIACSVKTVRKWRRFVNLITAEVRCGDGVNSARIAVRVKLKRPANTMGIRP